VPFNPYFLGCAFLIIVGLLMLVTQRYLWSLPFFGGAATLYFMGMGSQSGGDGL